MSDIIVPSRPASWSRWLTLDRLVTLIVFIAIFSMAARFPLDTDGWWHLQSGRWMVENGQIPRVDPFSHTRFGQPWIDHGWLAQLIIYLTYRALGFGGLVLLVSALVTVAFYFAWLQCQGGERWTRAFVFIIAAVASGIIWSARPQMVTFALTALVAYILYRYKQGQRRIIWWLLPVMVFWANIHGGFAVGFILIAAYAFGELGNLILSSGAIAEEHSPHIGWGGLVKLLLVAAISFLALALNPNGIEMWTYPFRTVGIGVLQDYILEWQPPDFHQIYMHPFIWLLLAAITAFGLAGRRADFTDLTLVALFTYMSLLAVRNVPLFALISAPIIVRYGTMALSRWRGERWLAGTGKRRIQPAFMTLNWLLLIAVLGAGVLFVSSKMISASVVAEQPEELPVGAVAYLREHEPSGPIFNNYNWGGYLIWHLPQYPVFVDGRTDLYDDELLREYLAIYHAGDGWREGLDRYGINLALLESASSLSEKLNEDGEWERVYHDAIATVFVRN